MKEPAARLAKGKAKAKAIEPLLEGHTVVVFGDTTEIGLAAAIQAKAAGAHVVVIDSDVECARSAATRYGFHGWRAADPNCEAAIEKALLDIPRVDHLVLFGASTKDERVWASVHAVRALGRRLARDGSVTLVSGTLASRPITDDALLAATSAATEAIGRGLALELAPIRVNTLSPGPIDAPVYRKVAADSSDAVAPSMQATLPIQRFGKPEDAGAAVLFLIANGWMSGAPLH